MLKIARVAMLNINRLRRTNVSDAIAELDKAKDLLGNSIRFSHVVILLSCSSQNPNKISKQYLLFFFVFFFWLGESLNEYISFLHHRIAQGVLVKFAKDNRESEDQKDGQAALIILVDFLNLLQFVAHGKHEFALLCYIDCSWLQNLSRWFIVLPTVTVT